MSQNQEDQGLNVVTIEQRMRVKQVEAIMALSPCLDYSAAETLLILSELGKLQDVVDKQLEREKNGELPQPTQAVYKGAITISDPEPDEALKSQQD